MAIPLANPRTSRCRICQVGGCPDVPEDLDWYGTETLTVVSTENDTIEEGCTYNMESTGVVIQ